MISENGLDKAIKMVWGDLNTQLEQEREDSLSTLKQSLGRSNRSHIALKVKVDNLASENVKLSQRIYKLENSLSDLIDKLSTSKKLKKIIE